MIGPPGTPDDVVEFVESSQAGMSHDFEGIRLNEVANTAPGGLM